MSGRSLWTLADGRRVIGYRKTLRQRQAPSATEMPTLAVLFNLPAALSLLAPGPYHGSRVTVSEDATASAKMTTWDREKLFGLVADFIREVVRPGTPPWSVTMRLTSTARPNWSDEWRLTWIDKFVVIDKSRVVPLIYPPA